MPGKMWFIHSEDIVGERTNTFEWDTGLSLSGPTVSGARELVFTGAGSAALTAGSVVSFIRTSGTGLLTLKGNAGDVGIPVQDNFPIVISTRDSALVTVSVSAAATVNALEI